jgi:hypothetical protein
MGSFMYPLMVRKCSGLSLYRPISSILALYRSSRFSLRMLLYTIFWYLWFCSPNFWSSRAKLLVRRKDYCFGFHDFLDELVAGKLD